MLIKKSSINYHIKNLSNLLGIDTQQNLSFTDLLPFSLNDITAGTENELQTAVIGKGNNIDLAKTIRESNYYKNIIKRTTSGDTSKWVVNTLEELLENNEDVWENSWVRFPRRLISNYANHIFSQDILKDKKNSDGPCRDDIEKFILNQNGEEFLRIPVSYLLKLTLADAISSSDIIDSDMKKTGEKLLSCYINDNTSPEVISFHPVSSDKDIGKALSCETLKRYLLTQCLTMYANEKFKLARSGQKTIVYFAPNSPTRQKQLNNIITDSFYRELFMSPCLSGWDRGEEKYHYMNLCHQVMSRSQLNCIAKLKECNILISNLAFIPNISNTSLANNGTHISLGSKKITSALADNSTVFDKQDEKYIGDLVIKFSEHFLPLFVSTYSAAPYRIDFWDFHPEYVLGFLPHELDYTHLRQIWRRWRKKTHQKIFGNPVQPTGLEWFDKIISKLFNLRGDFIPDFRLIDYLMSVLSTEESSALNGEYENDKKLRKDLAALGVFDEKMSLYLLQKLREFSKQGFSGFEARYYSLFPDIINDMGDAINLQRLITMFAYKSIIKGTVTHNTIPDSPYLESERRQIFFESAIGIPTCYVSKNTSNAFLMKIIKKTKKTRLSKRYPGFFRILLKDYKNTLINILSEEAADIIELLEVKPMLKRLQLMINEPDIYSAAGRITSSILGKSNVKNPFELSGIEFNSMADNYYRNELRIKHTLEAYDQFILTVKKILEDKTSAGYHIKKLNRLFPSGNPLEFLLIIKRNIMTENLSVKQLYRLIQMILITIDYDINKNASCKPEIEKHVKAAP